MFESLNIIKYYVGQVREKPLWFERNGKYKIYKIVWAAWGQNVLTEMFAITEKSGLLYKKGKCLTSPSPSSHIVCCYKPLIYK